MCKKGRVKPSSDFTLTEEFRVDMDSLEKDLYTLQSEEWDRVKTILIKMEEIKLKYIGEYDYGESV